MEVSAVNLQDYNARPLLQVTITLLVITSLNVLMRCFVRIRIIRIFTWSDWFMIGAQVCSPPPYNLRTTLSDNRLYTQLMLQSYFLEFITVWAGMISQSQKRNE